VNDLLPYLSSISYINTLTLYKCPLNKASKLICESLLNNSHENQLNSLILNSTNSKDALFLSEQLPSSYQPNHSLTSLQIDVRDLTTLKYLLMLLPSLLILGQFFVYYEKDSNLIFLIDVLLGVDVKQNDEELFSESFNPCCFLAKLILRLRF